MKTAIIIAMILMILQLVDQLTHGTLDLNAVFVFFVLFFAFDKC